MQVAQFTRLVQDRLLETGASLHGVAVANGLPKDAMRSVLAGHTPKLDRAAEICRALGLEFYIGLPRESGIDAPTLPREATEALGLAEGASPAEAVKAIDARLSGGFDTAAQQDRVAVVVRTETKALQNKMASVVRAETEALRADLADASALARPANDDTAPPEARPVAVHQVAAAAGGGAFIEDAPPAGPAWFRRDWLDKYDIDPTRCVVIEVAGASMEPTLPDGCSILLDKTRVRRRAERIYAVTTSDGLVVKRAGKDGAGNWVLRSDHPAWVDAPWPDDAEMIGEVRWAGWSLS